MRPGVLFRARLRSHPSAVVGTDGARVSATATGGRLRFTLPAGVRLPLLRTHDGAAQVGLPDGSEGWVAASDLDVG